MSELGQKRQAAKEIACVARRVAEMQARLDEMKSDYEKRFGKAYREPRRAKPARPYTHVVRIEGGIGGCGDVVVRCPKCGKETAICAVSLSDVKRHFQKGLDGVFDYMADQAKRKALETGLCEDCQGE